MKSNYFKIAMPVLAVVLAIGGSFASKASEQSTAAKITGYITPFGRPACSITVQCSNLPGPACSAFYQGNLYQAFGKSWPGDTVCNIYAYRWE